MENKKLSVILAHYENRNLENIMKKLNTHPDIRIIGFANNGEDLIEKIRMMNPNAILMPFSLLDTTAVLVAKKVQELSLNCHVFVIHKNITDKLRDELKANGVSDIIEDDDSIGHKIYNYMKNIDNDDEENTKEVFEQTVILTYNPKGGVGKSTIAVNLAYALVNSPVYSEKKIALIDFDIGGANVTTISHISDKKAATKHIYFWSDLPSDIDMDYEDIESMMLKTDNGLLVLPMPINYSYAHQVDYELADKVLNILKKHFDIIVIDTGPNIMPATDAGLRHATHILLVADAERQSVKQLTRTIELLTINPVRQGDFTPVLERMFVVVNHTKPEGEWDLKAVDIARTIGRPFLREIPYSDSVRESLHGNSALQAVELNKNSHFSLQIKKLANDICNAYPEHIISGTKANILDRKKNDKKPRKKKISLFGKAT